VTLLPKKLQLQGAVEIDPQVPILPVTHCVSLSESHDLMKDPCFSGVWRKSRAVRDGFIWEIRV
jgi:hypothetical protein